MQPEPTQDPETEPETDARATVRAPDLVACMYSPEDYMIVLDTVGKLQQEAYKHMAELSQIQETCYRFSDLNTKLIDQNKELRHDLQTIATQLAAFAKGKNMGSLLKLLTNPSKYPSELDQIITIISKYTPDEHSK